MATKTYEQNIRDLIRLITCVINDDMPDEEWPKTLDLDGLYSVSVKHSLEALVGEALERIGIQDKHFRDAKAKALRNSILFNEERKKILAELDKQDIKYALLKGIILQNYYPKLGLRQMADNDILIEHARAVDVRTIMEKRGYRTVEFGNDADDIYQKEPIYNFEMHVNLFAEYVSKPFYEYYRNLWGKLAPKTEKTSEVFFTAEDFYIYLVAHEYKHFISGGTGLRSLLDIYLYLRKENLNLNYVKDETEKMGIAEFEEQNRELANHLFSGENLTEKEVEMLKFIMDAGVYGNEMNRAKSRSKQYGKGKLNYILKRLSIPISKKNVRYRAFAAHYPTFYKYKVLLPFLPIYRAFRSVKEKRFATEMKVVRSIGDRKEL